MKNLSTFIIEQKRYFENADKMIELQAKFGKDPEIAKPGRKSVILFFFKFFY